MRQKASPEKIKEVLETLYGFWLEHPELRLGQILLNLVYIRGSSQETANAKLWNMDEDTILLALEHWGRDS